MSGNYEHIISHPHHVSATRPRMSNYERAAQFSSFKAVTGYEDELCETARKKKKKLELTEVQQDDLAVFGRKRLNGLNHFIVMLSHLIGGFG